MTAKDVQQANAELRRLIIEGGMEAQPARVIRAAMQDHATELRAALLPFDRSAARSDQTRYVPLTDEQCDEYRRFNGSFNDMLRATHESGFHRASAAANEYFGNYYKEKFTEFCWAKERSPAAPEAT